MLCACTFFACSDKNEPIYEIDYQIDMSLTDDIISAKQTLIYDNGVKDGLTSTILRLNANCYAENAVNPAYSVPLNKYGGINVSKLTVDGVDAEIVYTEDKEYLVVNHTEKALSDEVSIYVEYSVSLPECALRLGHINGVYNLSSFYPTLAYYDEEGFRLDKYSKVGDTLLNQTATYSVNFSCSSNLVVASGMKQSSLTQTGNVQTITYYAENVRDMAFVCSPNFEVLSANFNDVPVYYFYVPTQPTPEEDTATLMQEEENLLNVATNALKVYSETFGAYPYEVYSVVRTPFDHEGMEYSGLVYVADDSLNPTTTIIHETAHQWWYGAVGNDCINESVLDEGLVTFCTAYYYELNGESDKFIKEMKDITRAYTMYEKLQNKRKEPLDLSLNKPIYDYNEYQYVMLIYYKGAMMFDNLYTLYGKEKFNACLKKYYQDNVNKIATLDDFIKCAKEVLSDDVDRIIDGWLSGKTVVTTFAEE